MADVFEAPIEGTPGAIAIPSVASGGATNKHTPALIAKVGNLAEAAGKGFLRQKASSDVEDAISGQKDFLTDNPDGGIQVQRDKILNDFNISMDSLAQGGNPELAMLNASAAIKKVSSIAPGWENDIKKAAIDKLGYDPGGLLIKSSLQRQAAQLDQELATNKLMQQHGFDPSVPAHRQAFGQAKRAEFMMKLLADSAKAKSEEAKGSTEDLGTVFNRSAAQYNTNSSDAIGAVLVKYSDSIPYAEFDNTGTITNLDNINEWWSSGQREAMLADIQNFESAYVSQMNQFAVQTGVKPSAVNSATSTTMARLKEYKSALQDKDSFRTLIDLGKVNDENERRELFNSDPAAKSLWIISGGRVDIGGPAGELLKQSALKNILTKRNFLPKATNNQGSTAEEESKWYKGVSDGTAGSTGSFNDIGAQSVIMTEVGKDPEKWNQIKDVDKANIYQSYSNLLNQETPSVRNTREYSELSKAMANPDFATGFRKHLNSLPDGGVEIVGNIEEYQTDSLISLTRDVRGAMQNSSGGTVNVIENGKPTVKQLTTADAMRITYDPEGGRISTMVDPKLQIPGVGGLDHQIAVKRIRKDIAMHGRNLETGWDDYRNMQDGVFSAGKSSAAIQQGHVQNLLASGVAENTYLPSGDPLVINETSFTAHEFGKVAGAYGVAPALNFGDKTYVKDDSTGRTLYVRQF